MTKRYSRQNRRLHQRSTELPTHTRQKIAPNEETIFAPKQQFTSNNCTNVLQLIKNFSICAKMYFLIYFFEHALFIDTLA
jgi:hypothetical protein